MREFTGKNAADQNRAADLCEPAQSKCTHAEMYAGEQIEHSDQAPALTATVRTLQCGHTVWGKKRLQETSHNWKNCWMVETWNQLIFISLASLQFFPIISLFHFKNIYCTETMRFENCMIWIQYSWMVQKPIFWLQKKNPFQRQNPTMVRISYPTKHQFDQIFEGVYQGAGLSGKPWFSVLGNHDWGGSSSGEKRACRNWWSQASVRGLIYHMKEFS